MESTSTPKLSYELPPFLKVYQDGTVERLVGNATVPPPLHPLTKSTDVTISPDLNLSARLYLPKSATSAAKLPILLYFHGGGFIIESAFSPSYQGYLNSLAAEANALIVSVEYRRAPEHPLPAAYDDAWIAFKWVAAGGDDWVCRHGDLNRVFIAGDSAGANIAHNLGVKIGGEELDEVKVAGIVLAHPFFMGKDVLDGEGGEMRDFGERLWEVANPNSGGLDDPWINPSCDLNLSKMGCRKVLVFVAEKDALAKRGWNYYEHLKSCGWNGNLEILESKDEDHVFHIWLKPDCDNAKVLMEKFVSFLNPDM